MSDGTGFEVYDSVVAHFLLIYDRKAGKLLRMQEFASSAEALDVRFAAERENDLDPNVEVVVISAASEAALRQSHGRYFLTNEQLVAGLRAA